MAGNDAERVYRKIWSIISKAYDNEEISGYEMFGILERIKDDLHVSVNELMLHDEHKHKEKKKSRKKGNEDIEYMRYTG